MKLFKKSNPAPAAQAQAASDQKKGLFGKDKKPSIDELQNRVTVLTEQNAHLNTYIIKLSEENENLQMRITDLKTSLEQTKQMFEDYMN